MPQFKYKTVFLKFPLNHVKMKCLSLTRNTQHELVYLMAASAACSLQVHHGKRVSCCSPVFFSLFSCLHFIARTTHHRLENQFSFRAAVFPQVSKGSYDDFIKTPIYQITTRVFFGWRYFRVYFRFGKRRSSRAIICLLGEPRKRFFRRGRIWHGNAPKARGHLTKYCSSVDTQTCLVSFGRTIPRFLATVFEIYRRFYHILRRIFFPSRLYSSSQQPAIICLCASFFDLGSRGGRDRLVFSIIAHSE